MGGAWIDITYFHQWFGTIFQWLLGWLLKCHKTMQNLETTYYILGSLSFCTLKKNRSFDDLIEELKPGQSKRGQKKFQLHRFLDTFTAGSWKKVFKKWCSLKFFWPFLFCNGFNCVKDKRLRVFLFRFTVCQNQFQNKTTFVSGKKLNKNNICYRILTLKCL